MLSKSAVVLAGIMVSAGSGTVPYATAPMVQPNSNVARAGTLRDGVLSITLVAAESEFRINGPHRPPMTVAAFSEPGKAPLMPGPFIRVPRGTQIRVSVRNSLDAPLTFFVPAAIHGWHDALDGGDSVVVPAGGEKLLVTSATVPGNYAYRAVTTHRASRQALLEGLLAGGIVIDTARTMTRSHDRVFVIMQTLDSSFTAYEDTAHTPIAVAPPEAGRVVFTINGRSWPNTERIHATEGDSLHWRIIDASLEPHPMHLHGFYFRVDEFDGPLADYQGRPAPGQLAVTQLMTGFSGMSMTWSPDRPGNWLFHCHFAIHLEPKNSMGGDMDGAHMRDMAGLVLGVEVAPRPGSAVVREPVAVRHLRLVAVADSSAGPGPDTLPSMRFVLEEQGRRIDSRTDISPDIDLTRGVPVSIMIVNHLTEPTSVHWHGIEVEDSYVDGVPGFSGAGNHLAPEIAPGDSFEARFTPPRSGTFMYHAHVDEVRQQTAGLEGALIVRDPDATVSPDDHVFFLKGQRFNRSHPLEIDGQARPDTVVLHVGHVARFRILNLSTQTPTPTISLTARAGPASAQSSGRDSMLVRWTPIAKDGAQLPSTGQVARPASQLVTMGETYDFDFTPTQPGMLGLEVHSTPPPGIRIPRNLLIRVPIRVTN